jgi:hypothetical protein
MSLLRMGLLTRLRCLDVSRVPAQSDQVSLNVCIVIDRKSAGADVRELYPTFALHVAMNVVSRRDRLLAPDRTGSAFHTKRKRISGRQLRPVGRLLQKRPARRRGFLQVELDLWNEFRYGLSLPSTMNVYQSLQLTLVPRIL